MTSYNPANIIKEECHFILTELEKNQDIPLVIPQDITTLPKKIITLPQEINYYSVVYSIMYACGDVKNPLVSSTNLMYNILVKQMTLLIKKAGDIMNLRKGNKIYHGDVLFLMQKNKVLLRRLLLFLNVEDAKVCFMSACRRTGAEYSPENGEKVSQCLKYLSSIEKFTGDLTSILKDKSIVDHVYMKRFKRKDLMAESMTTEEYLSFSEYTLRATFYHKYTDEVFNKWLQQCSSTTTDITPLALLIINFLARETIAMIIDKALEIKSRNHKDRDNFLIENFSNTVDLCCELKHDMSESESNLPLPLSEVYEDNCYTSSSKEISNSNKTFHDNSRKTKRTCDMNATSKSNDAQFSKKCYATDEDFSSSFNKIQKDYSFSISFQENLQKDCRFSLNFQEKPLSICYDGCKIFEIGTNSVTKVDRFNKSTDTEDWQHQLATSCFMELIEEPVMDSSKTDDSVSRSLLSDFGKHIGHFPSTNPIKIDYETHWFPEQAITPAEIKAAFLHYLYTSPMPYLMKTKVPHLPQKEEKLICLVNPDDLM